MSMFAKISLAGVVACCCLAAADYVGANSRQPSAGAISFYAVPLMCPAARGLGCGSRAKPMLLELERTEAISEAWLDHSGEMLAIVWSESSSAVQRASALKQIADKHEVSLDEITGPAREGSITAFRSGNGWHRGSDVDRLSEQEALVIANRLLKRTALEAPSSKGKADAIRPELTESLRQLLVGTMPSMEECREKLTKIGRKHFNEAELSAFEHAFERGYRPIDSEQ
jgi:hypothetical protein